MKYHINKPSEFIAEPLTDEIRSVAAEAERIRSLHDVQLSIIHKEGWFNMYVPKEYGGLGLSLPDILRIEEGLSWADGSTGWVVTLCSGAAWFIGFLDPHLVKEVFEDTLVCFAGSGAVTGTANKSSSGYEIKGYWKYATGSLHATVFTVNCYVSENDTPAYNPDGTPAVQSFLLKREEVMVHKTWNSMGMIATGSQAIEIKKVLVPLNRSFTIDPAHTKLPDPIFKYPFLQLAENTLAVNLSGMANRFLDLCVDLFSNKTEGLQASTLLNILDDNRIKLNDCRNAFYTRTDEAWNALIIDKNIPGSLLESLSIVSYRLAHRSREVVNNLYPYCGLKAADVETEINRVWRNIHTAGQHSLFNSRT